MMTTISALVPCSQRCATFRWMPAVCLGSVLLLASSLDAQPERIEHPLLVVGFMGGRVKANNFAHKEAVIARDLQQHNGNRIMVLTFANHDRANALKAVLKYVDLDGDGRMSDEERKHARIILYGHSWGASETINIARELDHRNVPVLLTIQVDSVQKLGEDDSSIPPNVRHAMNFYQTEGLLNGRRAIHAADPQKTTILGNDLLSYRTAPVDTSAFPWFARTFMRPHIEIENDPRVWDRVEAMIQSEADAGVPTP
jgi:hypothetical protein